MKIEKKHIIVGGLALISIAAAAAYWQYKKLMNYCIGLNKIKINTVNSGEANFDLSLNFSNKSDVAINILSQQYNVYVNNKFIVSASNLKSQIISPDSMSIIAVNVKFNPSQTGNNLLSAVLALGNTAIKVDVKLKVKVWLFTINIPYVYETTLKELMMPSTEPKKDMICK